MVKICLSCTFYRLEDHQSGRCRVDRGSIDPQAYPLMLHEDHCERWRDAGQHYHIRRGWLRARQK